MSTLAVDQFNAAVAGMISHLSSFLPVAVAPAPQSTLALLEAAERPVGVGAFAGNVERGPLAVLGVRGGRVEGRVRFDMRAATPADAAAAALQLQADVRAARVDPLKPWMRSFLVLEPAGGEPAALVSPTEGWRQSVEYRVLYEYSYEDPEDAGGLIVRIPIELRGEQHEDDAVTRDVTRWDREAAGELRVRGPRSVGTISALSFPGAGLPGGTVTVLRTHGAAAGPPASHVDLPTFVNAVAVLGGRHDQVEFASLTAFLAAFAPDGADVHLADLNGVPAAYHALKLDDLAAARLADPGEVLRVWYQNPALAVNDPQHFPPASESVVYLRAGRGPSA